MTKDLPWVPDNLANIVTDILTSDITFWGLTQFQWNLCMIEQIILSTQHLYCSPIKKLLQPSHAIDTMRESLKVTRMQMRETLPIFLNNENIPEICLVDRSYL